jgi:hypothetical protein
MMQRLDDVFKEQAAQNRGRATPQQVKTIYALLKQRNLPIPGYELALLPYGQAVAIISRLQK